LVYFWISYSEANYKLYLFYNISVYASEISLRDVPNAFSFSSSLDSKSVYKSFLYLFNVSSYSFSVLISSDSRFNFSYRTTRTSFSSLIFWDNLSFRYFRSTLRAFFSSMSFFYSSPSSSSFSSSSSSISLTTVSSVFLSLEIRDGNSVSVSLTDL